MANTSKITIRGKIMEDGAEKSVTLATFSNLDTTAVEEAFSDNTKTEAFLKKVQEITSATVTGITLATSPVFETDEIGTPGDKLDSSEIFSADYSDTTVVPTLNLVNVDENGKGKNFNVKYMADPVNTSNFETKVNALGSAIGALSNTYFASANLTFSAKDEVARAD